MTARAGRVASVTGSASGRATTPSRSRAAPSAPVASKAAPLPAPAGAAHGLPELRLGSVPVALVPEQPSPVDRGKLGPGADRSLAVVMAEERGSRRGEVAAAHRQVGGDAGRVLPEPPAPTRVTGRDDPTSSPTAATSATRPTKLDDWRARSGAKPGLSSERSGGSPSRCPVPRAGRSARGTRGPSVDACRGHAASRPQGGSPAPTRPSPPTRGPVPRARPPRRERRDARRSRRARSAPGAPPQSGATAAPARDAPRTTPRPRACAGWRCSPSAPPRIAWCARTTAA